MDDSERLISEEELKTPLTHEQAKKLQLLISKVLPEFERFLRHTKERSRNENRLRKSI